MSNERVKELLLSISQMALAAVQSLDANDDDGFNTALGDLDSDWEKLQKEL